MEKQGPFHHSGKGNVTLTLKVATVFRFPAVDAPYIALEVAHHKHQTVFW